MPGGSASVLEAIVPYSIEALAAFLGAKPEHACSEATARGMAMAAYERGRALAGDAGPVAGIGCTASLASDRPKRGAHRAHIAWQTDVVTGVLSIEFQKGLRTRGAEEAVLSALVLNAIREATGAKGEPIAASLEQNERVGERRLEAPAAWQELLAGSRKSVIGTGDVAPAPKAIFPGAFNPRHHGHDAMREVAEATLGTAVDYEISIENVDKPPLDFIEMEDRLRQFGNGERVWFTRAPRFTQKAGLFPGATFVVGADTIARIADPRYYGNDEAARDQAIVEIADKSCRFLVFGRVAQGIYQGLANLRLPANLRALCQEVPEAVFRRDVSSTELRAAIESAQAATSELL